jgi:hypothetical protein
MRPRDRIRGADSLVLEEVYAVDEHCPASRRGPLTGTSSRLGGRLEYRGVFPCPATTSRRHPHSATNDFDLQAWESPGREDDNDADDRDA